MAAQFIVPRLCARLRHQAVEVSFVDLPNFFRRQLARVGTQDPAERPGFVFAKTMTMGIMGADTIPYARPHHDKPNPVAAQFIVPRLCACPRHQAVEVSFVDLPKVFQATTRAGRHARSDRASQICFCQEHDHGDHGGGTQYRTRSHIMTSRNPVAAQFMMSTRCPAARRRSLRFCKNFCTPSSR